MDFFDLIEEKKLHLELKNFNSFELVDFEFIGALKETPTLENAKNQLFSILIENFDIALISYISNSGFIFRDKNIDALYITQNSVETEGFFSKIKLADQIPSTTIDLWPKNKEYKVFGLHIVTKSKNCYSFQIYGDHSTLMPFLEGQKKVIFKEQK